MRRFLNFIARTIANSKKHTIRLYDNNRKYIHGFLFVCLHGMVSCAYVPFTQSLRREHRLSDDEIRNLQFWSYRNLILERELTQDSRQITARHDLLIRNGRQIERVYLDNLTPGIVVNVLDERRLELSFEQCTSFVFIPFLKDVQYYRQVHNVNWYCLEVDQANGTVTYSNQKYWITSNEGLPCLLVRKNFQSDLSNTKHKLPGRKL